MTTMFFALVLGQSSMPSPTAVESMQKMKQIAIATLMYAQDNGDRLPIAKVYKAALTPYLKDPSAFTAPGAPKGSIGYFLDPRLSGVKMNQPPFPAKIAMVLQGTAGKAALPYGGKTPVGYLDGHIKIVDAAGLAAARKSPVK